MSIRFRLLGVALLVCTFDASANSGLLFDDFQDGNADGWSSGGKGDVAVSEYAGNKSLRLTQKAYALHRLNVSGQTQITIGGAFAARDLEDDDRCLLQVSLDNGASWTTALRVVDGQDDVLTLHSGATTVAVPNDVSEALVIARVAGNGSDDTCWLDNVYVAGNKQPEVSDRPVDQQRLTAKLLASGRGEFGPLPYTEYAAPARPKLPLHKFNGRLRFAAETRYSGFAIVEDSWGRSKNKANRVSELPAFDFEFAQRGNDIVATERGVVRSDHPYWEFIVQPGTVWHDPQDGDWSRAAVPFALQERSANCTHNGVMTFLFDDEQVSHVAYQIATETCSYFKFDLWGLSAATAERGEQTAAGQAELDRLEKHRATRLPVKPLSELAERYPAATISALGIGDGIAPTDISVLGMLVDGVHYRSICGSRYGPYPFCDSMALPSYSLAKSMFAGVGLMRMEKLLPNTSKRSLASLIEACRNEDMQGVTIEHALDMATGNNRSADYMVDEDSDEHLEFVFSDKHADKLEFACTYFKRQFEPGTRFNYHTSDTYLVGTALQQLAREEFSVDLYDGLLRRDLWNPLELSPLLDDSKRTYDSAAQPFAGYGLTLETDDIVRIADWLNRGAIINGKPALDAPMLAASLQQDPDDIGPDIGIESLRYNNGFWAFNAGPTIGCEQELWVPFMSGVSGITIAMFPNDVIYYYFSDTKIYRWQTARESANAIKALCS